MSFFCVWHVNTATFCKSRFLLPTNKQFDWNLSKIAFVQESNIDKYPFPNMTGTIVVPAFSPSQECCSNWAAICIIFHSFISQIRVLFSDTGKTTKMSLLISSHTWTRLVNFTTCYFSYLSYYGRWFKYVSKICTNTKKWLQSTVKFRRCLDWPVLTFYLM